MNYIKYVYIYERLTCFEAAQSPEVTEIMAGS